MTSSTNYAQASWRALGSYVQLVVADEDRLESARRQAVDLLDAVDRACSRFRDDSDLVRANRAAGSWVRVSPLLIEAVDVALLAADATAGLVDPTLGRSLVALGYDRDLDEVRAVATSLPTNVPALSPAPLEEQAWRRVRTDLDPAAVFVPEGVALDLGATGKAFAADRIAAAVAGSFGVGCIVSLGGDVAVGATPDEPRHDWQVEVQETPESEAAETVSLPDGGLATSTILHRTWTQHGRPVHHLLDPATGRPVQRAWRTASVRAATCVAANLASTAAIVLGERAEDWLLGHGLSARLVGQDGTVRRIGGWPAPAVRAHTGSLPEGVPR